MKRPLLLPLIISFFILNSCSKDSERSEGPDVVSPTLNFAFAGFPNTSTEGEPIVVSNQMEINIDAKDVGGITKVEAFIDEVKVGEDATAPYTIVVNVSSYSSKEGSTKKYKDYVLKITATDESGNTTSKEEKINIDNELPSITDVSLKDNTVISGETNGLTFNVTDNEELSSVVVFIGTKVLDEIYTENIELNIDTTVLTDGENILRIEATDAAKNVTTHAVNFIVDNTGPEILFDSILDGEIIDDILKFNPTITDSYSTVSSVELLYGDVLLQKFDDAKDIFINFDPDQHPVGAGSLTVKAIDKLGNQSLSAFPIEIYRRLITINIPENRLAPSITVPVVFISRMDGSLVTYKEILREDRQITLSVAEEFDQETEFMLSFYLQDNGGSTKISTHQNLTRNKPGTLNLKPSNRWVSEGLGPQIPITNFFTGDNILCSSGDTQHSNSWLSASAKYSGYLNSSEGYFYIGQAVSETNPNPFDLYYLYESNNSSSYKYTFLDSAVDESYVLDKNNFISTGVETRSLTATSSISTGSEYSVLSIFGALTNDDKLNNKFHLINLDIGYGIFGQPMEYQFNTIFPYFKHSFQFGKYYTERNGAPNENYTIPNLSLSYTNTDNVVNLDIQGTGHILGRMRCIDYDNPNYDWYITYDSQSTTNVIIPDLPQNISHPVVDLQQNGGIIVESVELLRYESIVDYNDYIDKVTKNQNKVLDTTKWYELVFSSKSGFLNRPNHEFVFF